MAKKREPIEMVEEIVEPIPRIDPEEESAIDGDPNWEFAVTHPSDVVVALPHSTDVFAFKARGYREARVGRDGVEFKHGIMRSGDEGSVMVWRDHTYMIAPRDHIEARTARMKAPNEKIRNQIFKGKHGVYGGTIRFSPEGRPVDSNPLPIG